MPPFRAAYAEGIAPVAVMMKSIIAVRAFAAAQRQDEPMTTRPEPKLFETTTSPEERQVARIQVRSFANSYEPGTPEALTQKALIGESDAFALPYVREALARAFADTSKLGINAVSLVRIGLQLQTTGLSLMQLVGTPGDVTEAVQRSASLEALRCCEFQTSIATAPSKDAQPAGPTS